MGLVEASSEWFATRGRGAAQSEATVKGESMPQHPKPTKEILNLLRAYFKARAAAETLYPIVTKIQKDLLDELAICFDPKFERVGAGRITDPGDAYCMSDADSERYYPALDAAYEKAVFDRLLQVIAHIY
jgi:hypothetical protein